MRYFVRYPVSLLYDTSVSADAKVLAGVLLHYDGPQGCFPAVKTLMQDLNAAKRTVLRSLAELEAYGFITRQRRGRKNFYRLHAVYDQPTRPASILRTGQLEIENEPAKRPPARHALDKIGAPAGTYSGPIGAPAGTNTGAPTGTYSGEKVPRRAPVLDQEPRSIKNQRQQEDAAAENAFRIGELLQADGFPADDGRCWAGELCDLDPEAVLRAARTMRSRAAYRAQEIRNPVGYLRDLVSKAGPVVTELPLEREPRDPNAVAQRALERLSSADRERAELLAASRGGGAIALTIAAAQVRRERATPPETG